MKGEGAGQCPTEDDRAGVVDSLADEDGSHVREVAQSSDPPKSPPDRLADRPRNGAVEIREAVVVPFRRVGTGRGRPAGQTRSASPPRDCPVEAGSREQSTEPVAVRARTRVSGNGGIPPGPMTFHFPPRPGADSLSAETRDRSFLPPQPRRVPSRASRPPPDDVPDRRQTGERPR